MISKFSLIGCFFCFLLLAKSSFASEIKLVFANEIPIIITAKLLKDEVVLDSTNFEAQKGESMVLESPLSGIHCISFDQKGSFYFYITNSLNLEVNVDLEKGKFEVINSLESQQMNRIFQNWQGEVTILNTLKEPTFEHFDRAFDSLASVALVDLENLPSPLPFPSFFVFITSIN